MNNEILVTGATGFLGRHLVEAVAAKGFVCAAADPGWRPTTVLQSGIASIVSAERAARA
jgi:uncharacterized protein YbjT (DUF2867 family)